MSKLEDKKEVIEKLQPKKEVKKPNYIFVMPYLSEKKEYKVGDKEHFENKKVIEFLTTKKIIKKWEN